MPSCSGCRSTRITFYGHAGGVPLSSGHVPTLALSPIDPCNACDAAAAAAGAKDAKFVAPPSFSRAACGLWPVASGHCHLLGRVADLLDPLCVHPLLGISFN